MTYKFDQSKKEQLKRLVDLIVEMYAPERIVLFGSQARGDWKPESDFDIFVVDAQIKRPMGEIHSAAAKTGIRLLYDALKTSSADIEKFKDSTNHVLSKMSSEGVDLYNKQENTKIN